MSENPLTSRWRENLHNRSGYVPKRGATWSVVSLFPSPSPQTVLHVHEKKAIRFLCMPFAAILNLLSFNLSPFSLHIFLSYVYIYIYILCANPMLLFFLSLPASVSSPPVFLCFSHARSSIESLIHLLVYLPPRSPYFYPFSNIG